MIESTCAAYATWLIICLTEVLRYLCSHALFTFQESQHRFGAFFFSSELGINKSGRKAYILIGRTRFHELNSTFVVCGLVFYQPFGLKRE
jgi:hypothetical protein